MKANLHFTMILIFILAIPCHAESPAERITERMDELVGGGEGYHDWVTDYDVLVRKKKKLLEKLKEAADKDGPKVIYIADNATINLSGKWEIEIPAGVTLASGRGRHGSLGALIYTKTLRPETKDKTPALFVVRNSNVRITGLRIRGPFGKVKPPGSGYLNTDGIKIYSKNKLRKINFEADNNEMWGWPHGAIYTTNVTNVDIHHNYFHHNRQDGFGYGVVTNLGHVKIHSNLFAYNRHDIACTGQPGSSYEARYNVSVEGLTSHAFDMHGCKDNSYYKACKENMKTAGKRIDIHDNIFLQRNREAVRIRGIPEVGAFISQNVFRSPKSRAIKQIYYKGNMNISPDNIYTVEPHLAWFISYSGRSYWRFKLLDDGDGPIKFGDFDGDGYADALKETGDSLLYSKGIRAGWVQLNPSIPSFGNTHIGAFDDEPGDDIFMVDDLVWYVSSGGSEKWKKIGYSGQKFKFLRFGDFDGNGITDIFHTSAHTWFVSFGVRRNGIGSRIGRTNWKKVAVSSQPLSQMRFGDFNGDGATDIFYNGRGIWYVSFANAKAPGKVKMENWKRINSSNIPLEQLGFGDFDGDGTTDIVYGDGKALYASWSGTSEWKKICNSAYRMTDDCKVSDANGDGRSDILCLRKLE